MKEISQVGTYWEIASENYEISQKEMEKNRRPNNRGGYVITLDPKRTSFKAALISIVFYGMWLEAKLNYCIGTQFGAEDLGKTKMKTLDEKMKYLGCEDQALRDRVKDYGKNIRNPVVHEKAHLDQEEIRIAQDEARKTHEIMTDVKNYFLNAHEVDSPSKCG